MCAISHPPMPRDRDEGDGSSPPQIFPLSASTRQDQARDTGSGMRVAMLGRGAAVVWVGRDRGSIPRATRTAWGARGARGGGPGAAGGLSVSISSLIAASRPIKNASVPPRKELEEKRKIHHFELPY